MAKKKPTKKLSKERKALNLAWKIVINQDVSTELSGQDTSILSNFREYVEEAAEDYDGFFSKLHVRTDISDDDRWELEGYEDVITRFVNVYELLKEETK